MCLMWSTVMANCITMLLKRVIWDVTSLRQTAAQVNVITLTLTVILWLVHVSLMVRLITLTKMVASVRPTAIVQILLSLKMVRLATSHQQVKSDVASLSTTQQLRHGTTLIKRGIVSLDVNTLMVTSITSRKMVANLRGKVSKKWH